MKKLDIITRLIISPIIKKPPRSLSSDKISFFSICGVFVVEAFNCFNKGVVVESSTARELDLSAKEIEGIKRHKMNVNEIVKPAGLKYIFMEYLFDTDTIIDLRQIIHEF